MKASPTIAALSAALSKAQPCFKHAVKDSNNPFFKSKYADLASVIEAIASPLQANGLSYLQPVIMEGEKACVETVLLHSSGEWISSLYPIVCAKQNDPQAFGAAVTYARRYSLQAMLGVAADDDDGETAAGRGELMKAGKVASTTGEVKQKKPAWSKEQSEEAGAIRAEIVELGGDEKFKALWSKMAYDEPSDCIDAMTGLLKELRDSHP